MLNAHASRINHGLKESALLLSGCPACLSVLYLSHFLHLPTVQHFHNLPLHMIGSEKPGHLSNGFPSVDSSRVHGPVFGDVCSTQRHRTAHLSQPQAPLNKHIHPSLCTLGLLLQLPFTSTGKNSTISTLESCMRL